MSHKFRLHGIRHTESLIQDDLEEDLLSHNGDQLQSMANAARRASITNGATGRVQTASGNRVKQEPVHKRRHSVAVTRKNTDWADFYLSTAANDKSIAGFLSFKSEDGPVDAEYFYNFIPKAVVNQDSQYKELLAVYNALRYWAGREVIKDKKLLLAVLDVETAALLKRAKVKGRKLGPQKVMILSEIEEICRRHNVEFRIADISAIPAETIIYALLNSDQADFKRRFQLLLLEQSHAKGAQYHAKEKLFPPVFV